jgi:hypothetical protein
MITVLFVAGSFGSTVEYCLRQFSNELTKVNTSATSILANGSMHGYRKEFHPVRMSEILAGQHLCPEIATPVYPSMDYMSPAETIKKIQPAITNNKKVVLIYFSTLRMAERNQLFCYYKLPDFIDHIMQNKHVQWNKQYNSWHDMQSHELREALSFYIDQLDQYLEIQEKINQNWMQITPDDLLYNFKPTLTNMIDHLQLTIDPDQNIDDFYTEWFGKQKYVLDEFDLVNQIMHDLVADKDFSWNNLSIISEAIIQSRLRRMGLEIVYDQYNQFPTNTDNLRKIIFKKKELNEH